MKKYFSYLIILVCFLILGNIKQVNAVEIDTDDIPNSTYIIGKCMFTRDVSDSYSGSLSTDVIMLAAKTIESNNLEDMIIYYKTARGVWINALTNQTLEIAKKVDIEYKNNEVYLELPELKASVVAEGVKKPSTIQYPQTCYDASSNTYYDCGNEEINWVLQTNYINTTFTVDSDKYNGTDVTGFEVYKKVENQYISVGSTNDITSVVIISDNSNATYVARVYKTKSNNDKIYSDYSEEIKVSAINNLPSEGRYVFNFPKENNEEQTQLESPKLKASVEINGVMESKVVHIDKRCYDESTTTYYDCGYDETIDFLQPYYINTTFTIDSDKYNGIDVTGFEVYKKVDNQYISVGSTNDITGNVVINDNSETIYVVRVYKTKSNEEKIYSEYSEEVEVPVVNSVPGEGKFIYDFPNGNNEEQTQLESPKLKANVEINGVMKSKVIHRSQSCYDESTTTYYDCGYDETINVLETNYVNTTFTIDSDKYNGTDVSGFEVYKKVENQYISVGSTNDVTGNVVINDNSKTTYVVRVYKTKSNEEKIYSEYSEEVEVPVVNNAPGEGKFIYSFPAE